MPNRNGKGPLNEGMMTGRRYGNCVQGEVADTVEVARFGEQQGYGRNCCGPRGCGTGRGVGRIAGGAGRRGGRYR